MCVAEWARRMACRRSASTTRLHRLTERHFAVLQVAMVQDQLTVALRVGDAKDEAASRTFNRAAVTYLSTTFAVEGRAIQDDRELVRRRQSETTSRAARCRRSRT